MRIAGFT
jgi:hypothetical protein